MFITINVVNAQGHTLFTHARSIAHAGDIGGTIHELTRDYPECIVNATFAGSRTRRGETSLRDTLRVMGTRRGEHVNA